MNKFIAVLRQKIAEAHQIRADALLSGSLPDYAAYRHEAGYLSGLEEALNIINDVEKELINDHHR